MSDTLAVDDLRGDLFAATLELHDELGSTNDRAKELAHEEITLPALIIADRQTAGRGRGANRWHASSGSLTFSLLIDPAGHGLTIDQQGLLAIAAGVAVIDAARQAAGVTAGLKWPNDVLIDGKKLAGVLIEAPRPDRWVIGVGINVSNRLDAAPAGVAGNATSLSEAAGRAVTRQAALESFLDSFRSRVSQLPTPAAGLLESAREACVLTGRRVTVQTGRQPISGLALGLTEEGALLIETGEATVPVRSGSVIHAEPA